MGILAPTSSKVTSGEIYCEGTATHRKGVVVRAGSTRNSLQLATKQRDEEIKREKKIRRQRN